MNKGTGLTLTAAVAFSAFHLAGGGSNTRTPGVVAAPRAEIVRVLTPAAKGGDGKAGPESAPKSGPIVGGCAAFTPDIDTDKKKFPLQDERGAAYSLLNNFFWTSGEDASKASSTAYSNVQVAIALAPDPRHTELSVVFDREMAALQQAAQDESYVYTSSWMPWSSESSTYSSLDDTQLSSELIADREACPGILLFRRYAANTAPTPDLDSNQSYQQGLIVFVVGEQPTGGINHGQWANAVAWANAHAPTAQTKLRVIGPTFSGSVVSLDRELRALPASFQSVQVLSGSVSSRASINWLTSQFAQHPAPHVDFGSFQENDDLQINRFLAYWQSHGTDPSDTAILSEDETVYGRQSHAPACIPKDHCPKTILELFYPRDLAALRVQYQKESVFSTGTPPGEHAVHSVLQDGAEADDTHSGSDTIPSYGGHVTPLRQEAILYSLVTELRSHHSRFVLLRCTNPLDFLFLTRFLHRAYPEGRIVLVGQDLLLRREIDTTEFRGVMGLSNYPLLPSDQHWSQLTDKTVKPHTHLIFESPLAEGIYLAARYTFDPQATPEGTSPDLSFQRKPDISGFTDPFWLHTPATRAPTWLTVVGRDGFWPVAVLNDQTRPLPSLMSSPSTMVQLTARDFTIPDKPLDLPLPWKLTALAALGLFFYHLYGLSNGLLRKEFPSSGPFAIFRPGKTHVQQVLLGLACALAGFLLAEVASISLPLHAANLLNPRGSGTVVWLFKLFAWFGPLVFTALIVWSQPPVLRRTAVLVQVPLVGVTWFLWYYFGYRISNNSATAVPLYHRMAHLTDGVSPLLPVIMLTGGFYFWIWQALAGSHLLGAGRPRLPHFEDTTAALPPWRIRIDRFINLTRIPKFWNSVFGPRFHNGPSVLNVSSLYIRISQVMARRIFSIANPLSSPLAVWGPSVGAGLAIRLLFRDDFLLVGLEGNYFAYAINIALIAALLLTLAESCRFYWTWIELRRLLTALDRLRLRRTFTRLRAVPHANLWSVSGQAQAIQNAFFVQQWDAAYRLNLIYPDSFTSIKNLVEYGNQFQINGLSKFAADLEWSEPTSLDDPAKISRSIRDLSQEATSELINWLHDFWQDERTSLVLEGVKDAAPAVGDIAAAATKQDASQPAPDAKQLDENRNALAMDLPDFQGIQTAEEFVCIHYIAFIQIVLARMRTMVLSMTCLFVAVCFAISCYPFVPRTQITVWMIVNLVLITFTVIYVYAGMERDETLSYITNTPSDKLGSAFWIKTAGFLAGPVLGLLTTQFPSISDSVLGWLQPGLDAFK